VGVASFRQHPAQLVQQLATADRPCCDSRDIGGAIRRLAGLGLFAGEVDGTFRSAFMISNQEQSASASRWSPTSDQITRCGLPEKAVASAIGWTGRGPESGQQKTCRPYSRPWRPAYAISSVCKSRRKTTVFLADCRRGLTTSFSIFLMLRDIDGSSLLQPSIARAQCIAAFRTRCDGRSHLRLSGGHRNMQDDLFFARWFISRAPPRPHSADRVEPPASHKAHVACEFLSKTDRANTTLFLGRALAFRF